MGSTNPQCTLVDKWSLVHVTTGAACGIVSALLAHHTEFPLIAGVVLSHAGFVVWEFVEIMMDHYGVEKFPSAECWENRYADVVFCALGFFVVFSVYVCAIAFNDYNRI